MLYVGRLARRPEELVKFAKRRLKHESNQERRKAKKKTEAAEPDLRMRVHDHESLKKTNVLWGALQGAQKNIVFVQHIVFGRLARRPKGSREF